jgi:hypothetical protein
MTEAPRWRLINAHYLNVPILPDGTKVEWEHKETNRENGRTLRTMHSVPMLLDPKDGADCNYPGEVIVAHAVANARNEPKDIIFVGTPTPEMEPLNDAAQKVTDLCKHRWINPIESIPSNGGMTSAESAFMQKMMEAFQGGAKPNASVPKGRLR